MNGPNSIRSRWGFPSLNDADWKSKHLPSSSGNKGWESYGDPTTTAIGPAFPMDTAFANESVALRKGTSSQAVPGASGNNMKVGMNAAANAQSNLTNTKMVYQSPEISNVKEVYNSNNDFKVNSFDQQPMDYSVNVTAPEEEEIFNVMSGSGQDMHAENLRYGESLAMHNQPKLSKVNPNERPKYALDPQEAEILQPGEKYFPDLSMENIEQLPSTFDENLSIPPQAPATTATPPETTTPPATTAGSAGGGTSEAAGKVSKLGTAAAIGLPLIAGISTHQKLQDTIGSLKDQRRSLEGALGNMANEEYATIRASRDSLSEERRQIGALEGDRLYGQLEKARGTKTGGLSSGSVKQLQDELTDTSRTRSDVSLARTEENTFAQEDKFLAEQFNERGKRSAELKQLNQQIDELDKDKSMNFVNSVADAGIGFLSVTNPALGMALSVGKSLIT